MKTKLILCSLLLLGGCPMFQDSRSQYVLTSKTYATTMNLLINARVEGKIADKDWLAVKAADNETFTLLQQWNTAVLTGQQFSPDLLISLNNVLQKLVDFQVEKAGEK